MANIGSFLGSLSDGHVTALRWFLERAGQVQGWPSPIETGDGPTHLATKAKGIYKPAWSIYALSVRESLSSTYRDLEPIVHADGSWSYPYFQENEDPASRDDEFTNRALMLCFRDRVPIGVFRQVRERPTQLYQILGVALVAGWRDGYFFLEGFSPEGVSRAVDSYGGIGDKSKERPSEIFDPSAVLDTRQRALVSVLTRRGQPKFRNALLKAYEQRCAVSSCDAVEALEACHISPYYGVGSNNVTNGLLLRCDLHTLFDLGLFVIESRSLRVRIAPALQKTTYRDLADLVLRSPHDPDEVPSEIALDAHRSWAGF